MEINSMEDSSATNSNSNISSNNSTNGNTSNDQKNKKIRVLPQHVVDLIAAGEVVQRPVSVIKELIENSLDANSTHIQVLVDGHCLRRMTVVDDGDGISRQDLPLLATRHATSKLRTTEDFETLRTFGFRGEAIAATSAVSRLTVTTKRRKKKQEHEQNRPSNDGGRRSSGGGGSSSVVDVAYTQTYENGKPAQPNKPPKPCARSKHGTTVVVEDLFYNVPHRRRAYEQRDTEEYTRILNVVQQYAVHYPTVGFVCQRTRSSSIKSSSSSSSSSSNKSSSYTSSSRNNNGGGLGVGSSSRSSSSRTGSNNRSIQMVDCNTSQLQSVKVAADALKEYTEDEKKRRRQQRQQQQQQQPSNGNDYTNDYDNDDDDDAKGPTIRAAVKNDPVVKSKIVDATKEVVSHVLESNIGKHLLHFECSSSNCPPSPSPSPSGVSSSSTRNNETEPSADTTTPTTTITTTKTIKDDPRQRHTFQYSAEIYYTPPFYESKNITSRSGSGSSSSSSSSSKASQRFILFLNDRIVDLHPLKRALEDVYVQLHGQSSSSSQTVAVQTKPVLVVSIQVPGWQVDVNVHPSKQRVSLVHEDELIQVLSKELRQKLEQQGRLFHPTTSMTQQRQQQQPIILSTPSKNEDGEETSYDNNDGKIARTQNCSDNSENAVSSKISKIRNPYASFSTKQTTAEKESVNKAADSDIDDKEEDGDGNVDEDDDAGGGGDGDTYETDNHGNMTLAKKSSTNNDDKKRKKKPVVPSSQVSTVSKKPRMMMTPASQVIRTCKAAPAGAIEPYLVRKSSTQLSSQFSQSPQLPQSRQHQGPDNETTGVATQENNVDTPEVTTKPHFNNAVVTPTTRFIHLPECPLSSSSEEMKKKKSDKDAVDMTQPGAFAKALQNERCTCPRDDEGRRAVMIKQTVFVRPKKVEPTKCEYTSIEELRKRIVRRVDKNVMDQLRQAQFVGCVSDERSLIQCDQHLVLINHMEMAKELFYQLALSHFHGGAPIAHLGNNDGTGGIHLETAIAYAFQIEDELNSPELQSELSYSENESPCNGVRSPTKLEISTTHRKMARQAASCLLDNAEMLQEYFSIRIEKRDDMKTQAGTPNIEDDGNALASAQDDVSCAFLTGLPELLEGHCPCLHGLPIFLLRLANQVNWEDEKPCFHGVSKELGSYYAMLPSNGDENDRDEMDTGKAESSSSSYVQHHLFPALSFLLLPSKKLSKEGHFAIQTNLSDLYKSFKR